mmetsp:Transcript_8455/g.16448  ORF Transcript_8455/g.16448 Transcript_8455/m.16448 type:complete len:380 (+) Transcript_8455:150-1289(+)
MMQTVERIIASVCSLHRESIGAAAFMIFGYVSLNLVLKWYFYERALTGKAQLETWKLQPKRTDNVKLAAHNWVPLFRRKPGVQPFHALICTTNLAVAASFAAFVTELNIRELGSLYSPPVKDFWVDLLQVFLVTFVMCIYETAGEYYFHRIFHLPFMYRNFHKLHHRYKAPSPFDDLYAHPVEVVLYYLILWGPAFWWPRVVPVRSFLLYMVIMGATGVIDHSGIRLGVPLLYTAEDHDKHHGLFNVNFGFPFAFMDMLHGTTAAAMQRQQQQQQEVASKENSEEDTKSKNGDLKGHRSKLKETDSRNLWRKSVSSVDSMSASKKKPAEQAVEDVYIQEEASKSEVLETSMSAASLQSTVEDEAVINRCASRNRSHDEG